MNNVFSAQLFFMHRLFLVNTSAPQNRRVLLKVRKIFLDYNLFKSAKHIQEQDLKQQRWSTRLFIILLFIALLILMIYSGIRQQTKTIIVNNPSLENVKDWQANSLIASSLQCPCSKISTDYKNLISLQPKFHQICSSDYITLQWLDGMQAVYNNYTGYFISFADFRVHFEFFQMLQGLCALANSTISDALTAFNDTQLVTAEFLNRKIFESQMNSSVEFFIQSTINDFLHLIHLFSNLTQVNQYMSEASGNMNVKPDDSSTNIGSILHLNIMPRISHVIGPGAQQCFCLNETSCKMPLGIFGNASTNSLIYAVSGLFLGCSSTLTLYASSLECFYDDNNCLFHLDQAAQTSFYSTFTRLNSNLSSRFSQNTPIGILLENLFIESWTINIS